MFQSVGHGNFIKASLTALIVCLLLAASIVLAIVLPSAALPLVAAIAALLLPLIYFATKGISDQNAVILSLGYLITIFTTSAQHVTAIPLGYALEFVLFGSTFAVIARFSALFRFDTASRIVVILWAMYFCLAILSTLTGRSSLVSAIWQGQYNLKLPLMFGFGCVVYWSQRQRGVLHFLTTYSWVAFCAFVLLEIVAPSMHQLLFGDPVDRNINPIISIGYRYRGPFNHPGYLATIASFFAIASLMKFSYANRLIRMGLVGIYISLVVLSGQRQELFALAIAGGVCALILNWRYIYPIATALICALAITIISLYYLSDIPMATTLERWGVIDSTRPASERFIISAKGVAIGMDYFPLGSGLGTYGGVGAQKIDQSLYYEMGFGSYWWFRQGRFLVDTFWPNIIAESGIVSAVLLLIVFATIWISLFLHAVRDRVQSNIALYGLGVGSLTLLLLDSPTSQILNDPRGSFLLWYVIGAAWRCRVKASMQGLLSTHFRHLGERGSG